MIMMDIPAPRTCDECPCSYYIMTGEYEGRMMCNAMEFKSHSMGFHEEVSKFFIVAEDHRPAGCPIMMEKVK